MHYGYYTSLEITRWTPAQFVQEGTYDQQKEGQRKLSLLSQRITIQHPNGIKMSAYHNRRSGS